MNATTAGARGGFKRRAMVFIVQLSRPISLGRLWLILFVLHIIANILAIIVRVIVVALA